MKNIFTAVLLILMTISISNASFIYEEIDPICSISGTTHTSFPWEISDTSGWYIPKAYDGECEMVEKLSPSDKKRIYTIVVEYLNEREYLVVSWNWYKLTPDWEIYIQDVFFEEVQDFIPDNRENLRAEAILNDAVKMIKYDYYIQWSQSVDYLGLTEVEAEALAEQRDVPFRIGEKDGEMYMVTMDYVIGRITATIENWIVVDYSIEW
jgi:hypothetical protein